MAVNKITSRYGSASISVGKPLVDVVVDKGAKHRVQAVLLDLSNCTTAGAKIAQLRTAERIKKTIRKHIRENGASLGKDWPALTPKTKKYKTKKGYASKAHLRWNFTGVIYNNIVINQRGLNTVVTLRPNVKNTKIGGDSTLAQIAMRMEYGTSKMPSRPLFRPVQREYKENGVLKTLTVYHIKRVIMMKHGVKVKVN